MRPGLELTALCLEAGRRGMSYGQLVGLTTASEQREIIDKYREKYPNRPPRKKKEGEGP